MIITCWGSRGSIPVSGKPYLKYGGDTTCIEVRTQSGDIIIVDAGTGIRRLGNRLIKEKRKKFHFIFTHAHWDHIMGFPFFKPLYYKNSEFRMHRCPFQSRYVEKILSRVMAPPNFPIKTADIKANLQYEDACPTEFRIGSVRIVPIPLSHPNGGSGYKFIENGKIFVFLTDNELGSVHPGGRPYEDYVQFAARADLLIHDAEYTPREYRSFFDWGHSVYTEVLKLGHDAGVKNLGLFHLNQDRTDAEMDDIVTDCRRIIADRKYGFDCFAVACDMTFTL
jgi:phosphoribosyl 1,2-cyclic phosphodiesterase